MRMEGERPEADGLLRHVRAPGPLVVKAPAEAGRKMAEAIRGEAALVCPPSMDCAHALAPAIHVAPDGHIKTLPETFKPIRALLPVWEDSVTGKPLDVEQLRRAMMGHG